MQGCGALISSLTRLLNNSVKIGHIPNYIGIEWGFILFESIIRRIISFHNNLRSNYWWVMNCSIFHKNLQCKYWWLTNNSILQHPFVNAKNKHLKIGVKHKVLRYFLSSISRKQSTRFTMLWHKDELKVTIVLLVKWRVEWVILVGLKLTTRGL